MKKDQSRVIQPIETKNGYSPLKTEESPTENGNTRTDSPNTKLAPKQNALITATQNTQNSNDKTKSDTPDKRKLPVTVLLGDYMVKDIKGWEMPCRTSKVVVKDFSGTKPKDIKSFLIETVE